MGPITSPLRRLSRRVLPHRPYHLAVGPTKGEVIAAGSSEGAVTLLTPELRVLGALDFQSRVDGVAVSPDDGCLGLALRDRTCIMTTRGRVIREICHRPWSEWAGGGCAFTPDGRHFWAVRPGEGERRILVEVVECDGWRPLASNEFEVEEDGCWSFLPHPESEVTGLWLGAGQDGQWLYWCAFRDDRLHVEEEPALAWVGPPVFHPAGGEFLTDSLEEGLLRRHRFPDGEVLGQMDEPAIFPHADSNGERERFGQSTQYLSDRRVLAFSSEGRMSLLDLNSRRFDAEVLLENCDDPPGDVEQILMLKDGRLLVAHRNRVEHRMAPTYELGVWDASPLCCEMRGPEGSRPYTEAFHDRFLR